MAFTPDAPPAGHFTPDAPPAAPPAYQPDKTDIANQLASHPELPGVGDFVDILRNIPQHLVPALKGMLGNRSWTDPTGGGQSLMNLYHTVKSFAQDPMGTISAVGTKLSNATPQQAAPIYAGAVTGAGVGEAAAGAGALTDALGAGVEGSNLGLRVPFNAGSAPATRISNNHQAAVALARDAGVDTDTTPVNHGSLADAAEKPGAMLTSGAGLLPTAPLSPGAQSAIAAARPTLSLTKPTPNVTTAIDGIENNLLADPNRPVTGAQIRATRDSLSSDANAGYSSSDADTRAIARYKAKVVDALDQHISDTMPPNSAISPDMIANARATLAKNYALRDAIGPGGDIDLPSYAQQYRDNPNKFTGDTAVVAKFAHDHPEATGNITNEDRLSPPGVVTDIKNLNLVSHPLGSAAQALFGSIGRRLSLGSAGSRAAGVTTPVAGLGGEFDLKNLDSLHTPGTIGVPPARQVPLPLAPGQGQTPGITMQQPPGTAFAPHQPTLPGVPEGPPVELPGGGAAPSRGGTPLGRLFEPEGSGSPKGEAAAGNAHNDAIWQNVQQHLDRLNQTLTDNPGQGSRIHPVIAHLADNLDDSTPEGAFYKTLFSHLKDQNLTAHIIAPGTGGHEELGAAFGGYRGSGGGGGTITINNTANDLPTTIAHEATHAAVADQVSTNSVLQGNLNQIISDARNSPAVKALADQDRYGLKNPQELVAEAKANMRLQQALRNSPSPRTPGKSLYDDYKQAVGTSLRLPPTAYNSPMFDQVMTGANA